MVRKHLGNQKNAGFSPFLPLPYMVINKISEKSHQTKTKNDTY
jgi:hypothetical protein